MATDVIDLLDSDEEEVTVALPLAPSRSSSSQTVIEIDDALEDDDQVVFLLRFRLISPSLAAAFHEMYSHVVHLFCVSSGDYPAA